MKLPDLPLIFEDDGYLIELSEDGPYIRITNILVYCGNSNNDPTETKFFSLSSDAKHAVIAQINRRYPGKVVKV